MTPAAINGTRHTWRCTEGHHVLTVIVPEGDPEPTPPTDRCPTMSTITHRPCGKPVTKIGAG